MSHVERGWEGYPPMGDINNEATENTHVFLLLESGRKGPLFYDGRTEKDSWGFQNTLRKLIGSKSFRSFAATNSL